MPGVALIAHFDGDANDLTHQFRTAARRYADIPEAPQPAMAALLRNKEGVTVVLVWPEGTSLGPFRTLLKDVLSELELPHPRTEHFRAEEIGWDALTHRD